MTRRLLPTWQRRLTRRLPAPFPVVAGNRVRAIERGPEFMDSMLRAIDDAEYSVDVEMYLWDDDSVGRRFTQSLAAAATRGLAVRILVDAFGAREVIDGSLVDAATAGADVRVFNPFRFPMFHRLYHRTHKKLLVVDRRTAFCGGAGFSLHFSGMKRREQPWQDRMFAIDGPLVTQFVTAFEADFERWNTHVERGAGPTLGPPSEAPRFGGARGRVLRGWPDARDFPQSLLIAVNEAEDRILIGTPYFMPPRPLRRALRRALQRGVRIEIVAPAYQGASALLWYASRRHYGGMLRHGARIHEYGPAFYHAKLAVVDHDRAFIGSSNLDAWSWRRNAELDVVFEDSETVAIVEDRFAADREHSTEVTLDAYRARGPLHRLSERLAGIFDDWL